eukprot:CAMPEP_0116018968 /NCGR_PEP_ID=MMETSP0321-20121206/8956_1 /TAXON_ID=163516 /ORGANISM="Leptocylindrus danicus var. danicus, Strain B650" /LENGTH=103 /DNA_ID=CAMNT_0003489447 /DNA_START=210 /DNA_END=521 /DNA_ORIENTATION=+
MFFLPKNHTRRKKSNEPTLAQTSSTASTREEEAAELQEAMFQSQLEFALAASKNENPVEAAALAVQEASVQSDTSSRKGSEDHDVAAGHHEAKDVFRELPAIV